MSPRDVMLRVRRADLQRWRDIAHKHRMPLDGLIDVAIRAYDADRDADAKLGRDVRALVATTDLVHATTDLVHACVCGAPRQDGPCVCGAVHRPCAHGALWCHMCDDDAPALVPRRSRDPRPTEPLVFDRDAAVAERMRDLRADDSTMPHRSDTDCTPYLVDNKCLACGCVHGDACRECGGRAYHLDTCKEI